ncbi:MAG TPA: hypothetical protein VJP02_01200 [Candidatus Sulfotelmatobacter sp.]|nr:hypothetical protein [Candidatus Sulfotelmatobacter sp.]
MTRILKGHSGPSATIFGLQALICLGVLILATSSCGTTKKDTSPTPPSQPGYPSTPPVSITWSPSSSPLPAPPSQVPPPPGSNDFPLSVSGPADGATVTSPVVVGASATPKNPIFFMRVYVDQLAVYFTFTSSINTQLFIAPGQHKLEVMAEDNQGYISATILNITVTSQSQTTISNIQSMSGWQSCSAVFPAGSGRDGQICAAGLGTAQSTLTQNQATPAMDGQSAQFSMGGPTAYSNMLYFNAIAGGDNVSHFTYDLYFYIDNPAASQALEFDINQTFGGNRWVWGSECNFNGSGKWDIWDDINGWQPTIYDCKPFPANTWIHLVWNVERVGNQVHYISLTVGDQTYNVDTYYPNQPDWTLEEIDVAFQMDGNYKQEPYNVWLDKVQLTAN